MTRVKKKKKGGAKTISLSEKKYVVSIPPAWPSQRGSKKRKKHKRGIPHGEEKGKTLFEDSCLVRNSFGFPQSIRTGQQKKRSQGGEGWTHLHYSDIDKLVATMYEQASRKGRKSDGTRKKRGVKKWIFLPRRTWGGEGGTRPHQPHLIMMKREIITLRNGKKKIHGGHFLGGGGEENSAGKQPVATAYIKIFVGVDRRKKERRESEFRCKKRKEDQSRGG